MYRLIALLTLALMVACEQEPKLTLAQQVKKISAECHDLAMQETGFDPLTTEEPPRTLSKTSRRGGEVVGSGALAKGAVQGAALGAIGGAIAGDAGTGAGVGAAIGGLMGGMRRRQETNEMVTRTYANPEYEKYNAGRKAFKSKFDACMAVRSGATGATE